MLSERVIVPLEILTISSSNFTTECETEIVKGERERYSLIKESLTLNSTFFSLFDTKIPRLTVHGSI